MLPRAAAKGWDPTEREFQLAVAQLARRHGWLVAHFHDAPVQQRRGGYAVFTAAQFDGRGFPDLILLRPPELLIVELKRNGGRLRPNQAVWLEQLGAVASAIGPLIDAAWDGEGVRPALESHVWRPRDWAFIERRLGRRWL